MSFAFSVAFSGSCICAQCLANQGFKVYIIEREPELGGMLKQLYKLYPTLKNASDGLDKLIESVKSNKRIDVLTSSVVQQVKGFIGNFDVTVKRESYMTANLKVGTIVLATGASVFEPVGMYGYGEYNNVVTQLQLESLLKENKLDKPETIVMIQCVGSREEKGRTYCSRICCMEALKNAMLLKESHPCIDVCILFRDLQTYGGHYEDYRRMAQDMGVKFVKYILEKPPKVVPAENGKLNVEVYHALLGEVVNIKADLVVLSTPLIQREDAKELSQMLKVPLGPDGFFLEAHVKLRPVDFATDGIYVCGTAHSPKDTAESISQALGVASRAAIPMAAHYLRTEAITSVVDENLCSGCGTCVKICPYGAIVKDERGVARVTEVVCKGCGICGASCPEKAISMRHFTDDQIIAQALAAVGRITA
jgi:heterodisulfide reductase subunit A